MKRLFLIFLPLCLVAMYPNPGICGSAAIDALGTAGAGVSFDGGNTGTMMAFGGVNVPISEGKLDIISRTAYVWTDRDDVEEVQGGQQLVFVTTDVYKTWFVSIGSGMTVNFQNPDKGDMTDFNLVVETGYKWWNVNWLVGCQVTSTALGKHKTVYAGIGLN